MNCQDFFSLKWKTGSNYNTALPRNKWPPITTTWPTLSMDRGLSTLFSLFLVKMEFYHDGIWLTRGVVGLKPRKQHLTLVLIVLVGKDLNLEGSTTKLEDKQVPGIYVYYILIYIYTLYIISQKLTAFALKNHGSRRRSWERHPFRWPTCC